MLYETLIPEPRAAILAKVQEVGSRLLIPADWLMIVFKIEATKNGKIDSTAVNPYTGATGYIQFMPSTARSLGTSVQALAAMSPVDQLEYVYKYFAPYRGKLQSVQDLYTVTFFPKALGKPDDYILKTDTISAGTIAAQNRPYDLNKDNQITYGELKAAITKKIPSDAMIFIKKK